MWKGGRALTVNAKQKRVGYIHLQEGTAAALPAEEGVYLQHFS